MEETVSGCFFLNTVYNKSCEIITREDTVKWYTHAGVIPLWNYKHFIL